ncbi:MAG: antibiotic biosynthesis monooxygenase [Syntrophotaleaceae bacterium]
MIIAIIKIFPKPGRKQVIIEVLDSVKGPISNDANCLDCAVMVDGNGNGALYFIEQWHTREAFDRHLRSALYNRVLEALEGSLQPPEIKFCEATFLGGLELVEKARNLSLGETKY